MATPKEQKHTAAPPDFIVHDKADNVGVAVVENIESGKEVTGWIMETDETIKLKSLDVVPLGHKIALKNFNPGDTVLKYGNDVGKIVSKVALGGHVHTQNLKTKRW